MSVSGRQWPTIRKVSYNSESPLARGKFDVRDRTLGIARNQCTSSVCASELEPLNNEIPEFIGRGLWPSDSHECNPVELRCMHVFTIRLFGTWSTSRSSIVLTAGMGCNEKCHFRGTDTAYSLM